MTLSPWVESARIIIVLEGFGGIAFNSMLIYYLLRRNIGSAAKLYRISCLVSAISNIYTSSLMAIVINVSFKSNYEINIFKLLMPLMIGGSFVPTLYGPLLSLLPDKLTDFIFVAFSSQVHMMWEMIPAPSILQYLSLYKSNSRSYRKLLYAYIIPVLLQINSWGHMFKCVPTEKFRRELQEIVAQLHGAGPNDCRIYGLPVISRHGEYDLMTMIYYDVFPSYLASYGLFIFTAVQIRAKLRSFGKKMSDHTQRMQRRFFLTQIAQIFLPLVLLSFPTGLIVISAFLGVDLANFSFLFVFAFWISPSAQALLLVCFVRKSARCGPDMSTKVSETKVSTAVKNN